MSANSDQAKGRVKEAVGDLTGNDQMKSEGQADRVAGGAKEKIDAAIDKVKGVLHKD